MNEVSESKFCDQCGESLTPLLNIHQSKTCSRSNCDKKIYFESWAEGGGITLNAGCQLHIPAGFIKLSLDPKDGHLTREGLKGLVQEIFRGPAIPDESKGFIEFLNEQEKRIDKELSALDWISHLDLSNANDAKDAEQILKKESKYYWYMLYQSSCYGEAYRALKDNDYEKALHNAYIAHVFHSYASLNLEHFEDILWLGYDCYHDMKSNNSNFNNSKKERLLLEQFANQIKQLEDTYLHVLVNDGRPIASRLHFKSIDEETAKHALIHEQKRRLTAHESSIKEKDQKIQLFGVKSTIAIGLISAVLGFLAAWLTK